MGYKTPLLKRITSHYFSGKVGLIAKKAEPAIVCSCSLIAEIGLALGKYILLFGLILSVLYLLLPLG
jgi:hypothetical protein